MYWGSYQQEKWRRQQRRQKRRRVLVWTALLAVLAMLAGSLGWFVFEIKANHGAMPNLPVAYNRQDPNRDSLNELSIRKIAALTILYAHYRNRSSADWEAVYQDRQQKIEVQRYRRYKLGQRVYQAKGHQVIYVLNKRAAFIFDPHAKKKSTPIVLASKAGSRRTSLGEEAVTVKHEDAWGEVSAIASHVVFAQATSSKGSSDDEPLIANDGSKHRSRETEQAAGSRSSGRSGRSSNSSGSATRTSTRATSQTRSSQPARSVSRAANQTASSQISSAQAAVAAVQRRYGNAGTQYGSMTTANSQTVDDGRGNQVYWVRGQARGQNNSAGSFGTGDYYVYPDGRIVPR